MMSLCNFLLYMHVQKYVLFKFYLNSQQSLAYLGGWAFGNTSPKKSRLTGPWWSTLIVFPACNLIYQTFFNQNVFVYLCIFVRDAVKLMVSCSLPLFMQKITFSVERIHKKLLQAELLFLAQLNQIVQRPGLHPRPHWGSLQRSVRPSSSIYGAYF